MSRLFFLIIFLVFGIFVIAPIAHAEGTKVTVDLSTLDPDLAKQIIQAQQQASKKAVITVDEARDWAGVGKEVAAAITATANGLSIEVNKFIETPVGWWAMFLVVWLLIGAKLVKLALGLILVPILIVVWFKSMKRFFWQKPPHEFAANDARVVCGMVHFVAAAAIFIVSLVVVFGII